jgi:DMSO/TMAO reductase YedYZ molybdopterin-dependent catalytic subunit
MTDEPREQDREDLHPAETPPAESAPPDAAAPPQAGPELPTPPPPPEPPPPPPPKKRRSLADALAEPPEIPLEVLRHKLQSQSRRAFLLSTLGLIAAAVGAWWLMPDRTKARLLPAYARDKLDTLAARVGLTSDRRERTLDKALTFDDDVAEALYSKDRSVRTYRRSDVTRLPNNYHGATPGPDYLPAWTLNLSGLASGKQERLTLEDLLARFPHHEQTTRLVCVEGWSAIAPWGGFRFADLLAAFPPAPGMKWAAMR